MGTMVWGKLPGYDWWPGVTVSYIAGDKDDKEGENEVQGGEREVLVWVKWYGENNLSQVSVPNNFVVHNGKGGCIYRKHVSHTKIVIMYIYFNYVHLLVVLS